jgi:hypothetical protein
MYLNLVNELSSAQSLVDDRPAEDHLLPRVICVRNMYYINIVNRIKLQDLR